MSPRPLEKRTLHGRVEGQLLCQNLTDIHGADPQPNSLLCRAAAFSKYVEWGL